MTFSEIKSWTRLLTRETKFLLKSRHSRESWRRLCERAATIPGCSGWGLAARRGGARSDAGGRPSSLEIGRDGRVPDHSHGEPAGPPVKGDLDLPGLLEFGIAAILERRADDLDRAGAVHADPSVVVGIFPRATADDLGGVTVLAADGKKTVIAGVLELRVARGQRRATVRLSLRDLVGGVAKVDRVHRIPVDSAGPPTSVAADIELAVVAAGGSVAILTGIHDAVPAVRAVGERAVQIAGQIPVAGVALLTRVDDTVPALGTPGRGALTRDCGRDDLVTGLASGLVLDRPFPTPNTGIETCFLELGVARLEIRVDLVAGGGRRVRLAAGHDDRDGGGDERELGDERERAKRDLHGFLFRNAQLRPLSGSQAKRM